MSSVSRLAPLRSHLLSRSLRCCLHPREYTQNSSAPPSRPDHTASAKLFEDAAREEAAEEEAFRKSSLVSSLETKHKNWTGDEPVEHAVLRMLVDKYKPLRGGPIKTAEEKLKAAPPQVCSQGAPHEPVGDDHSTGTVSGILEEASVRTYVPGEPILPGIPGHQPWHTTFTVPSHATSNVRYGNIPLPKSTVSPLPLDDKARRKEKETRRRMQQGARLSQARESTLDYRLGIKGGAAGRFRRPNPVTLKGWASLVEDRIEKARLAGHFNNVKGRGAPLARTAEDKNPFIGREEFLMNRIVQRQGAAPPWVEIQGELETAISAFREVLKQSWTRRALHTLTHMHPAELLPRPTLADVVALRDEEWEEKERTYHERALEEVNALVRKYNGLAPYAVRRAYYMRGAELGRAYGEAGEAILRGLEERAKRASGGVPRRRSNSEEGEGGGGGSGSDGPSSGPLRLRDMFREMVNAIRGR